MIVSPSLLSADFCNLQKDVEMINRSEAELLHLDIMDGVFVPNISFGFPVLKNLKNICDKPLDVHLMIVEPEKYVEEFRKAGADIINFHVEATKYPAEVIQQIKATGAKAGITINPRTPVEVVYPFLKDVDMVLVMTVEPGFGGQKFMAQHVSKIRQLAEWKKELGLEFDIEVDGGVTLDNVREVLDAGANVIVAGSAVFGKEDIAGAAKGFLDIFKEYE
mgnify:CR=1 FL=1